MNAWYTYMFRIECPDPQKPRWWVDLFLLDTVVRDFIATNAKHLSLWRFHRRFNLDEAGHQFSFIYYTSSEISEEFKSFASDHRAVAVLQMAGFLREKLQKVNGSKIEATCDPSWPFPLQQAWPYYIMGASQMVLDLVDRLRTSPCPALDGISVNEYEHYYTKLMTDLTMVWKNFGSHAYFHHLNALFGYDPLIAQPRQIAGFLATF